MASQTRMSGEFDRVLDDRFRVVVPAPWRRTLMEMTEENPVLMCSPALNGGALELRTTEQFNRWVSQLAKHEPTGRLSGVQLSMLSHCKQVEVDSRGSITLPDVLVRLVNLHREVTWKGNGDAMVLCNRRRRQN